MSSTETEGLLLKRGERAAAAGAWALAYRRRCRRHCCRPTELPPSTPPSPTSTPPAGDYVASWRTRYFVLHSGGLEPQLAYFRGARREAGPPAGVLRLAGAHVAIDPHNLTAFAVSDAAGRTYHLKAASAGQRQHWTDAISSAVRHAAAAAAHALLPAAGSPSPSRRPTGLAVPGLAGFQGRRASTQSDAPLPSPGGSSVATPGSAWRPPRAQRSWASALFHHSSSTEAEARGASRSGSDVAAAAAAAQQQTPALLGPAVEAQEAYSASLPALQGPRGGAPIQALMAGLQSSLPLESIDEHYQRALLFVERHTAELSGEQLAVLAVRMLAACCVVK